MELAGTVTFPAYMLQRMQKAEIKLNVGSLDQIGEIGPETCFTRITPCSSLKSNFCSNKQKRVPSKTKWLQMI